MKKFISVLTAVIICVTYAADAAVKKIVSPADWVIEYREPTQEEQKRITDYIKSTDEMRNISVDEETVHSGNYSIKAVNKREKKQLYTYSELKLKDKSQLEEGEYTFEFFAKGDFEPKGIEAGFGESSNPKTGMLIALNSSRISKSEPDDYGWIKYSVPLKYNSGDELHFRIAYGCEYIYIDDVQLLKEGVNVLKDGGFENVEIEEISLPKGDDYNISDSFSPDYPRMVYIETLSNQIGLNWQNAESSDISEVGIYKSGAGENILIDNAFPKSAGAWCNYLIQKEDDESVYKIVTSFSDGRKTEYIIPQESTYKGKTDPWKIDNNPGPEGKLLYVPGTAGVDENVSHSGEASLRVSFSSPTVSNLFFKFLQNVDFELGHKYYISFWTRGEKAGGLVGRYGWKPFDDGGSFSGSDNNYDWMRREFTLTYNDKANSDELFFIVQEATHALWIDDFEVYEIDESGNKIGNNLVKNPGFERDASLSEPAAISNFRGTPGDGKVILSWDGNKSCEAIRLYRLVNGKYVLIGQFDNSPKSGIAVGGLENEKEEVFAVTSMNKWFGESEKTVCTVTPIAPDYRIGKTQIIGGFKQGDNTVSVKIDNNKLENDFCAEVMAVVRKGLMMTEIKNEKLVLKKGESKTAELTVNIPDTENYSVSVYIWDDFRTMKKLVDFTVFKSE